VGVMLAHENERQDRSGEAIETVTCLFGEREHKLSRSQAMH
jgi:hypothetical protein